MESKIMVVEDDKSLIDVLSYNLKREGYAVITAMDGVTALETARSQKPHLIIMDIMLPGMSGLEVCRILRLETTTPILILSAKDQEIDKVVGLELGADDYLTKPFSMRELLARVKAMLRRVEMEQRSSPADVDVYAAENIKVDVARREATLSGKKLSLSPKEFDLLAFLVRHKGLVFTRDHILEKVWGYDYAGETRTVDVHIRWLREKLEVDPARPRRILTVRGTGYKLNPTDDTSDQARLTGN